MANTFIKWSTHLNTTENENALIDLEFLYGNGYVDKKSKYEFIKYAIAQVHSEILDEVATRKSKEVYENVTP